MSEPVTISLSAGQVAQFRDLDRREQAAKTIPQERSAAAMSVVLRWYAPEQVSGKNLAIDVEAGTITFTPD